MILCQIKLPALLREANRYDLTSRKSAREAG